MLGLPFTPLEIILVSGLFLIMAAGVMVNEPRIVVPDMCQTHQALLLRQIGIGPDGPWRSAIISAQVTLFQGATAHPGTYERIGGDVTRIGELGCLACYRPDTFGEVVQAFQHGGMGAVKALGERLVQAGGKATG